MKNKRMILFRLGAVALLIAIAASMMVIGRGHTVYLDNKTLDYNGQTYSTPYKIVIFVDGEQVAKLYDREGGMATCIGQKFDMTLEITQEKGGNEETTTVTVALPYGMDGVAINLPAYLAGLPEDAYLTEFVATSAEEEPTDEAPVDEFALEGLEQ